MIGAGIRAVAAANERRAERRLERYRIKQQTKIAVAEAQGRGKLDEAASRRELTKLLAQHDRTDARWLDYEVDVAKLLDFPMMTDMRQPLTVAFHKSRSRADLLRPATDRRRHRRPRDAMLDYRDAVHDYAAAFDVAEAEAIRSRRSDFSTEGQQRSNARSCCCGWPPTSRRHRRSAGAPTPGRSTELDGLIVLPAITSASIERRIAGEIEA